MNIWSLTREYVTHESAYTKTRNTFTYGIIVSLPLILIYSAGLPIVNEGKTYWAMNGAYAFLRDVGSLSGLLPNYVGDVVIILGIMCGVLWERGRKVVRWNAGYIVFTINEAVMWSLFIGIPARWVTYLVPNTTASSIGENARVLLVKPLSSYIVQSCDAGFFEELLFRVILLGGILAVLRYVHVPKQCAWMISIVVSALIFANVHTNEFGGIFMVDSFLYRSYLGFLLGIIYLWRGFGVAVWTHTLFDAFLYITFFLTATSV